MMITAPFWASVALLVSGVVAEQVDTRRPPTPTTITTAAGSTCTATLLTQLCDYKEPISGTAVAASGRNGCWDYCNENPPCNFVIFLRGNPYYDTGTCWLYPGEDFDPSLGDTSCGHSDYLSVYDKPVCAGDSTTSAGACAATASPSAVASICGYPPPDEGCFYDCSAQSGAVGCMSQCAERDNCNYAVFNPRNEALSPYHGGTCWMYPSGTYNPALATASCTGAPEQYVYNNVCPKPSRTASSLSPSATAGSGGSGGSGTAGAAPGSTNGGGAGSDGTGTAGAAPGTGNGGTTNSDGTETGGDGSVDSAAINADGTPTAGDTTTVKNSAAAGLSLTNPLAVGVAALFWQAFQ